MSRTVVHGGLVGAASDGIRLDVPAVGGRFAAPPAHGTDTGGSIRRGEGVVRTRDQVISSGAGRVSCEAAA